MKVVGSGSELSFSLGSHAYFLDTDRFQILPDHYFFLHVLEEDPEDTPSSQSHENTHQLTSATF